MNIEDLEPHDLIIAKSSSYHLTSGKSYEVIDIERKMRKSFWITDNLGESHEFTFANAHKFFNGFTPPENPSFTGTEKSSLMFIFSLNG